MKRTIVDAIRQVMKAEGNPMTPREVYYSTIREGLYDFKAKEPIQVVASQIRKHCTGKDAKSYAGTKFFQPAGNGRYQLLAHETQTSHQTFAAIPAHIESGLDQPTRQQLSSVQRPENNRSEKRTIILAIKEVMLSYGRPMNVQQVYEAIIKGGLYRFKASQPVHVVRSQIRRHCVGLDFPTAADLKHFELRGKNKYYVLPSPLREKSELGRLGSSGEGEKTARKQDTLVPSTKIEPRDQVFISYSHKDTKWLQRLQVHLRPLQRLGIIDLWDDSRIKPGTEWRNEIEKAVKRARVAVMLISADFLASEFIMDNELAPLLHAAASEGAWILPVIISPCRFEKTDGIRQFQAVNPPDKPLSALNRTKREEVFMKVADAVEGVLYSQ
jgi:TIR domain-containing protein/HB1/ASXL restriction endonuclease-like protein with HTH domain